MRLVLEPEDGSAFVVVADDAVKEHDSAAPVAAYKLDELLMPGFERFGREPEESGAAANRRDQGDLGTLMEDFVGRDVFVVNGEDQCAQERLDDRVFVREPFLEVTDTSSVGKLHDDVPGADEVVQPGEESEGYLHLNSILASNASLAARCIFAEIHS
jgi:hypothetical protein